MSFKFLNSLTYERLRLFAKDLYSFTGRLPNYEQFGLILQLRQLSTTLLQDFASGQVRAAKEDTKAALDHCITTLAKIVTLIDLCFQLNYIDSVTQQKWISSCDEVTKRLYEARKSSD